MTLAEISTLLKTYFSDKPVLKVAVFGSYSRNAQTQDSDLDIMLTMERPVGLMALSGYINDLEDLLHIHVDLGTEKGLSPHVRPYVEKDLMVIYEK